MIKNYFKVAWRYMIKNKVSSTINIVGLTAGMAVALLIGLWVYNQYSYDRFLPGYSNLYQVKLNFFNNGDIQTQSGSSLPVIEEMRKKYPEVKYASETDWGGQHSLVAGEQKLNPNGRAVGVDFLKMFPYAMVEGNASLAFSDPNSIILTESVAKALFGSHDPMNRLIKIDNKNNVKVTGIMKDLPINSTLQFSYLLPYSYLEQTYPDTKKDRTSWPNYSFLEYVQLQPGTNVTTFEKKLTSLITSHDPDHKVALVLQPARNWRLYNHFINGKATDGLIQYVRTSAIIGMLVLLIACINFVNLSTARSEKRAREVGVRKSIGSSRKNLIFQFLTEALLVSFVSFLLSLVVVRMVLPYYNSITHGNIEIPFTNVYFWCIMLGYVLVTGLLAGSRPAFYLSSFQPVKVLKGPIKVGKGAALPRKILVVVQFSCSIALIICTIVIYKEIKYAKDRPIGYNADRLIMINSSDDLNRNYDALKTDLLKTGQVENITKAASPMTYFPALFQVSDWPGKKPDESLSMVTTATSRDYFKTVGMTLKQGHDFGGDESVDSMNIILNESAVEKLHLQDPVNQLITFEYSKKPMRVIGVVKNAIIGSPFYLVNPAIFVYNPGWTGSIMFRLKTNVNTQEALAKIATVFNRYNPSFPFDYIFADDAFNASFNQEEFVGGLAIVFAGLAILISCLGLFGLATYIAEQRKKEIGIRKVLGASLAQVWFLLSREFIILVVVSCVIASPIAYHFMEKWLQTFEYRIGIGTSAFFIATALTLIITLVTISFQAIGNALAKPVKSLRSE